MHAPRGGQAFTGEFFVQFVLCLLPGTACNKAHPSWSPRQMPMFAEEGQYQVRKHTHTTQC